MVPPRWGTNNNIIEWLEYLINRDPMVNSQVAIDVVHHEIHEGEHFEYCIKDTAVGTANPKQILIKTPDSAVRAHFDFHASASHGARIELWGPVDPQLGTFLGTARTFWNSERNNAGTTTVIMYENPTIPAGSYGTLRRGIVVGAGGKYSSSGDADSREELVLLQDSYYLIQVDPVADDDVTVYITPHLYES